MKHPSRGSLDATALSCARLTVPNLQSASTLVKHDKAQFINSYVRSQHAYRKAFESEGREARASWDKEKTGIAETDKPAQVIQNLVFATPVLKARVPEKKTDRPELQATRAHAPGSNIDPNETTEPKTKDKRSIPRRSSPSTRKRTIDDFSTKTKTKTKKWIRATDERKVDADAEREAILAGRRERRRTKKAIVDFKDDGKEVLEDDDSAARTTREKTKKKKKADNSAGLALMHGFTATNVGVSRLTMKPTVGVFTKGKASVRTGVLIKTKHTSK
ncbi:hypothetical protein BC835DRAFT_631091 [Cytidiella melzeri]|nr:hypothetical protein BC835DRAFT_631091 [Cytidiella melzeri]